MVFSKLRDPEHLDLLEDYVYGTRPVTAGLFSVLWKALLEYLRLQKEDDAVAALLKHYVVTDEAGAVTATWRCGADRVIPGQGPGSQSQESWHVHRLRAVMPGLRVPFEIAVKSLRKLQRSRADSIGQAPAIIHAVPGVKWKHDNVSGDALTVVGRTPARLYLTARCLEHAKAGWIGHAKFVQLRQFCNWQCGCF